MLVLRQTEFEIPNGYGDKFKIMCLSDALTCDGMIDRFQRGENAGVQKAHSSYPSRTPTVLWSGSEGLCLSTMRKLKASSLMSVYCFGYKSLPVRYKAFKLWAPVVLHRGRPV